eukprot:CAMPEP_0183428292 /NCGR_PEP_ID=MMETSP0370-20130417/44323_1 /TAXON_ID=268820 /ORGANISM="Peridinium aciculiferum, Strain PAER-2" /LENGTH=209 /DNA_ID=CAMNT_0025613051 /DNA_START=55 /DNA_END=684 /DNA_ORIENTATION=+
MELQLNLSGQDGTKYGVSGETVTSTRPNMMVFGGHSGQGMLYAKELANNRLCSSVTTVSKRGRPSAPGPGAAFVAAMSTETVHYMAACDVSDAKAVECLTDWAPPAQAEEEWPMEQLEDASAVEPWLAMIKRDVDSMNVVQLKNILQQLEDAKLHVIYQKRELRSRLQSKGYEREKAQMQEQEIELSEREATLLEVIADVTSKLNGLTH